MAGAGRHGYVAMAGLTVTEIAGAHPYLSLAEGLKLADEGRTR